MMTNAVWLSHGADAGSFGTPDWFVVRAPGEDQGDMAILEECEGLRREGRTVVAVAIPEAYQPRDRPFVLGMP